MCGENPSEFHPARFYSALRTDASSSGFLCVENQEEAPLVSELSEVFKQMLKLQ